VVQCPIIGAEREHATPPITKSPARFTVHGYKIQYNAPPGSGQESIRDPNAKNMQCGSKLPESQVDHDKRSVNVHKAASIVESEVIEPEKRIRFAPPASRGASHSAVARRSAGGTATCFACYSA